MMVAYPESLFSVAQKKVAAMFELAVDMLDKPIQDFAESFASSRVAKAFEQGDPVYICGKSANELVALVLGEEPDELEMNEEGSPEYWVGFVLALSQWRLNRPFMELIQTIPCDELLLKYFPYHEMDPEKVVVLFRKRLGLECPLSAFRKQRNLSQNDLAAISGVSVRAIRAYEQGAVEISKAQADTLFSLAKVLDCSIEDLIR